MLAHPQAGRIIYFLMFQNFFLFLHIFLLFRQKQKKAKETSAFSDWELTLEAGLHPKAEFDIKEIV